MDKLDAAGQVTLRLPGVSLKAIASPADQVLSLALFVLTFANYSLHLQRDMQIKYGLVRFVLNNTVLARVKD